MYGYGMAIPEETGMQWGIKARQIQELCSNGKISGAVRKSRIWLIPSNTPKPIDGRTRTAKTMKQGYAVK